MKFKNNKLTLYHNMCYAIHWNLHILWFHIVNLDSYFSITDLDSIYQDLTSDASIEERYLYLKDGTFQLNEPDSVRGTLDKHRQENKSCHCHSINKYIKLEEDPCGRLTLFYKNFTYSRQDSNVLVQKNLVSGISYFKQYGKYYVSDGKGIHIDKYHTFRSTNEILYKGSITLKLLEAIVHIINESLDCLYFEIVDDHLVFYNAMCNKLILKKIKIDYMFTVANGKIELLQIWEFYHGTEQFLNFKKYIIYYTEEFEELRNIIGTLIKIKSIE